MYHNLNLNSEEKSLLKKAIPWITLLIAGADGTIDDEELEWAKKITSIRSYNFPEGLSEYYQAVGLDFSSVLDAELGALPESQDERMSTLTSNLESLNEVLAKMPNNTAYDYYKSFTSFAEHVAKATGGFLRFFSVSVEEKKLLNLPMVKPFEFVAEEE